MSEATTRDEIRPGPRAAESTPGEAADPLDTLLKVSAGYCVSSTLHAVAELGIADALGDDPMPVDALAAAKGCDSDVLGRMLRLLSAHGVFSAAGPVVSHNPASRLLRSDHPQSARALARMFGLEICWSSQSDLAHSLRTGRPAHELRFPEGVWRWFGERPEASAIFDEAMIGKSHAQVASVVEAYDFSPFSRIADIGGGRGHLLRAILSRWPDKQGVLFDQPQVIKQARDAGAGSDRLELVAGDFFADPLPECDVYLLMEVIHDWQDGDAARILAAVARAAPPGAVLLVVEQLMPDSPDSHWVKMLDIHMLALFAAKQRSRGEYEKLAREAGFEPKRAIDTFSGATILESVKV